MQAFGVADNKISPSNRMPDRSKSRIRTRSPRKANSSPIGAGMSITKLHVLQIQPRSEEMMPDLAGDVEMDEGDAWETVMALKSKPYISTLIRDMDYDARQRFLSSLNVDSDDKALSTHSSGGNHRGTSSDLNMEVDPLWEQVKVEARHALDPEPQAGPQLYQHILSQETMLDAVINVVSNEIATELILATEMSNLFHKMLTPEDSHSIHMDVMAAAMRSPSVGDALTAILFNRGLHALVGQRVSHRLWNADRTGLAKYLQSTVSRIYQADIHPAAKFGSGIYMNCGSGIVIGETAVVGDDVSILQGVTLGGTGKERGDRHPKVGRGVILQDGATVLGNIKVGDGAVVTAKSIVTKEVPPLARVSGVPAKVRSYREAIAADSDNLVVVESNADKECVDYNDNDTVDDDGDEGLERQMRYKYLKRWEAAHDMEDVLSEQ